MATKRGASKVLLDPSPATKRKSRTKSINVSCRNYRDGGLSAVSKYPYGIQRQGRYIREEDVPRRARSTMRDPTIKSKKKGTFPDIDMIRGTKDYNFDRRQHITKSDFQSGFQSVFGLGKKLTSSSSLPQKWLASRKRDELANYHSPLRSKSSYRDSMGSSSLSFNLRKKGVPRTKHRSISSDAQNFKKISVISRYSSQCVESEAHSSTARRIVEMKKFLQDISKKGSSELEVTRRQVLVSSMDRNVVLMKGYLSQISSLSNSQGNIDFKEKAAADQNNPDAVCQAVILYKAHGNTAQPIKTVSQVHYASKTHGNRLLPIQNLMQALSPRNSQSDTSEQEINCPCRTDILSQQQQIRNELLAGESDTKKDNPCITDILSQKRQIINDSPLTGDSDTFQDNPFITDIFSKQLKIRNDSPLTGDSNTLQDNPFITDIFCKQLQIRNDSPLSGESNTEQNNLFNRDILSQQWQTREDSHFAGESNTKQNNPASRKAVILANSKSPIGSLLDGFGSSTSVTQSICSNMSAEESQRTSAYFVCGDESQAMEDQLLECAEDDWPSKNSQDESLNNEQQETCLEPKLSSENVYSQNEASKQKTNQTVNCQSLCQFQHPRKPAPPKITSRFSQLQMQAHGVQVLEDSTRGTADDSGLFMLSDNIMHNENENFELVTMSKHSYKAETFASTLLLNQHDTSATFKDITSRRSISCPFLRRRRENCFCMMSMPSQIPHGLNREGSDCWQNCFSDTPRDDSRSSSEFVKRKVKKTFVNAQRCGLNPSNGYNFVFQKIKFYFLMFVLLALCISLAYLATSEYLTLQSDQKEIFTEDSMQT